MPYTSIVKVLELKSAVLVADYDPQQVDGNFISKRFGSLLAI